MDVVIKFEIMADSIVQAVWPGHMLLLLLLLMAAHFILCHAVWISSTSIIVESFFRHLIPLVWIVCSFSESPRESKASICSLSLSLQCHTCACLRMDILSSSGIWKHGYPIPSTFVYGLGYLIYLKPMTFAGCNINTHMSFKLLRVGQMRIWICFILSSFKMQVIWLRKVRQKLLITERT